MDRLFPTCQSCILPLSPPKICFVSTKICLATCNLATLGPQFYTVRYIFVCVVHVHFCHKCTPSSHHHWVGKASCTVHFHFNSSSFTLLFSDLFSGMDAFKTGLTLKCLWISNTAIKHNLSINGPRSHQSPPHSLHPQTYVYIYCN